MYYRKDWFDEAGLAAPTTMAKSARGNRSSNRIVRSEDGSAKFNALAKFNGTEPSNTDASSSPASSRDAVSKIKLKGRRESRFTTLIHRGIQNAEPPRRCG